MPIAVVEAISSPDRLVRIAAAEPVAALGEAARDALPALEEWLTSDERYFRVVGGATILKIDSSQADRLLPVLVEGLSSEPCPVRSAAAEALGDLGPAATTALPALQHCLSDEVESVRCEAAVAIWKITGDPTPAVQIGVAFLDNPHWTIRFLGAEHLGLMGPVASPAIPALEAACDDEAVRFEAEQALDRITGRQPVPRW